MKFRAFGLLLTVGRAPSRKSYGPQQIVVEALPLAKRNMASEHITIQGTGVLDKIRREVNERWAREYAAAAREHKRHCGACGQIPPQR